MGSLTPGQPAEASLFPSPYEDLGPVTTVVLWTMFGITTLFLGTRLCCKYMRHRRLHLDDVTLVFSWVSFWSICLTVAGILAHGNGTLP